MRRPTVLRFAALIGACSIAFLCRAAPPVFGVAGDEEDDPVEIPELDEVRGYIEELELEEAGKALKEAKKALGSRKREKEVKAALKAMEQNLKALKEFKKAQDAADKKKIGKALKSAGKVLREYGEIFFVGKAEALYADLKKKAFYMINDFESEEFRDDKMYKTSRSGATVEVVADRRISHDGRHALKVHFDERAAGVKEQDAEAYRAVHLVTPDGFSRELEGFKAISFALFSYGKSNAKLGLIIQGGGNTSYARYPGLTLNFSGWRPYTVGLKQFKFNGTFRWRDARDIAIYTRSLPGADFIIDDVKFIR